MTSGSAARRSSASRRRRLTVTIAMAVTLVALVAYGLTRPGTSQTQALPNAPQPRGDASTANSPSPVAQPASVAFPLGPVHGKGHLAPGSDPSVLPGPILIADRANNRLLVVDPTGHIRWQFPRPGDLRPGQKFLVPDDAFLSANGRDIVATEEDYSVISVIDIATHRIVRRYGHPAVPGAARDYVHNPDDALMLPNGDLLTADIKNCRILVIGAHVQRPVRTYGVTGGCAHRPPQDFGSPNGAFPMTDGSYLITEIGHDWVDKMSLSGKVAWSVHPPGIVYPSDTNEVGPDRFLTVGYTTRGKVEEFNHRGKILWRYHSSSIAGELNHPSLALPLPNGDVLLNDDYNDRVIVIDPHTNNIVWQYGHRDIHGTRAGYLHIPDGVDLLPPYSLVGTHAPTMGLPSGATR